MAAALSSRCSCSLLALSLLFCSVVVSAQASVEPSTDGVVPSTTTTATVSDDCFAKPSMACVEKKIILLIDRLSRIKAIRLFGDWISVVRVDKESENNPTSSNEITDSSSRSTSYDFSTFTSLLEKKLDKFLESHVVRVALPTGVIARVDGESREFGSSVDISIGRAIAEARKKMKMKNMLHMMLSGLMSKAALMGPLLMMIVKMKALKALMLSTLALMLSKLQLFKMLMKGKGNSKEVIILHEMHGGGGHGGQASWSSAGGGYGGGGGAWASATGDSYSTSGAGAGGGGWGGGGGGGAGGWASRMYDPTWLVYRHNRTLSAISAQDNNNNNNYNNSKNKKQM
ncbi:hypothetical protein LSTR_LSTR008438 [Laodelphax striatellus]|uniref:Uncharacterized protein n=1 Tax=Laodelphax striatellus TaxID=195883 RepID=A0A482XT21_LAOST|nr:hypothetical protein LSTR_LSTR008438 [Laodelphax striatellus]